MRKKDHSSFSEKDTLTRKQGLLDIAITDQHIAVSGLAGFFAAWVICEVAALPSDVWLPLFLSTTAIPMAVLTYIKLGFGRIPFLPLMQPRPILTTRLCRLWTKYIGLIVTLLLLCLGYRLIPIYQKPEFVPIWKLGSSLLIALAVLALPYFVWMDGRMEQPEDGYFQFGMLLRRQYRSTDWLELKNYVLGWIVKGFFLPIMLASGAEHIGRLQQLGLDWHSFEFLYGTCINLLYTIDVVFGAIGYIFALRILDTHIRSVEPTFFGWGIAICCYPPFADILWSDKYLGYKGKTHWMEWLADYPVVSITWGFCIVMLTAFYVWATCSFGCRFSNLTHRGIITDGPYTIMRHPAYFSKNLAWWMMYIPFAAHSAWSENLRASICLLITNGIYYLRAKTEERHLKKDPVYLGYWNWMEEKSLFAEIKGMIWKRKFEGDT